MRRVFTVTGILRTALRHRGMNSKGRKLPLRWEMNIEETLGSLHRGGITDVCTERNTDLYTEGE